MKKSLIIILLLQVILLLGVLFISYLEIDRYTKNNSWILHSQEILRTLNRVQIADLEAQNSVRSYVISKNPKYISTFEEASTKVFNENLVNLTKDNPEQNQRAVNLREKLLAKKNFRSEFIYSDNPNMDGWNKVQEDPRGESLSREINLLFEEFRSEELRLLDIRNEDLKTDIIWLRVLASGIILIGLLLIGTGYYLFFASLNRERKLKIELLQRQEEIEKVNKELEQFVYISSHDLQQPLRNIRSYCELLQFKYGRQLDEGANEYINTIISGTNKMSELIKDLLQYSRSGKIKDFNKIDTRKLILDILAEMPESEVVVNNLPVILSDENSLRQIFQNLISNAIKFSNNLPVIKIEGKDINTHWLFSVEDKGIGIDMAYKDKIFEAFQRIDNETEGTGIGLAIVKKNVEKLGGKVWADSELGKGSTFYFTIKK